MTEQELCETMNKLALKVIEQGQEPNDSYELLISPKAYWGKMPTNLHRWHAGTMTSDTGIKAHLIIDNTVAEQDVYLINMDRMP